MASIHDVAAHKLIFAVAAELEKNPELKTPEWAKFVKTGVHKERPPIQKNWFQIRAAAVLRTILLNGPVGVSKLRSKYGGVKNRGVKPHRFKKSSGKVIRVVLQQLEKAGYVQKSEGLGKGRVITPQGQALLDNTANKLMGVSKKDGKSKASRKEEPASKSKKAK